MVEYNTVDAKISDSQLNKLTNAVKNRQGTTFKNECQKAKKCN